MPNKGAKRVDKTEPINTQGMADVAIQALMLGLDLGWEATVMHNGSLRLSIDHDGRAVAVNLPSNQTSIKEGVARSWLRKVIRYGDPMKMELLTTAYQNLNSPDSAERASAEAYVRGLHSSGIQKNPGLLARMIKVEGGGTVADYAETVLEREIDEVTAEVTREMDALVGAGPPVPDPDPAAERVPHVVKVKPWMAKHSISGSQARTYESKAVLERKWSDGSADYQCSLCDYTNAEARSVSAHYGKSHPEQPATPAYEEVMVNPGAHWTPTERQQGRIRRLANEMQAASEALGGEMTAYECAQWIVQHRDEARDKHLEDEGTPLTNDQVVARIRSLVDGGVYADLLARLDEVQMQCAAQVAQARADTEAQMAEMARHDTGAKNAVSVIEKRLAEAEEQARVAEAAEAAALAQAREATDKWKALRELINE